MGGGGAGGRGLGRGPGRRRAGRSSAGAAAQRPLREGRAAGGRRGSRRGAGAERAAAAQPSEFASEPAAPAPPAAAAAAAARAGMQDAGERRAPAAAAASPVADECRPAASALGLDGPRLGRAAPSGRRGRAPALATRYGPAPRRPAAPRAARLAGARRAAAAAAAAALCARPRRRRCAPPPPAPRAGNVPLSPASGAGAPCPASPLLLGAALAGPRCPGPGARVPPPPASWLPKPQDAAKAAGLRQQSSCFAVPFCLQAVFSSIFLGLSDKPCRDSHPVAPRRAALATTCARARGAVQSAVLKSPRRSRSRPRRTVATYRREVNTFTVFARLEKRAGNQ